MEKLTGNGTDAVKSVTFDLTVLSSFNYNYQKMKVTNCEGRKGNDQNNETADVTENINRSNMNSSSHDALGAGNRTSNVAMEMNI